MCLKKGLALLGCVTARHWEKGYMFRDEFVGHNRLRLRL